MPKRPEPGDLAPHQVAYTGLLPDGDILTILRHQEERLPRIAAGIAPAQESFRYAPGKWSVRQVFGHLADAERIFGYRILSLARQGTEPLPPFDENLFVATAHFDQRPLASLAEELSLLRRANLLLMHSLSDEAWTHRGVVSSLSTTANAVAWVLGGHLQHHLVILNERYGLPTP